MNQLVNIFKLLSDETRLRIIILLAQEELCVCQIQGILKVSQPKVSRNLAKLRDMDYVIEERRERYVYYKLKKEDVVLNNTIKFIIDSIEQYSQIKLDQMNIKEKEIYLSQCNQ